MGKRKDRRLAAQSNAGRRVKLDLFAEPSGDLGGSSIIKEELGEDIDPTQPKSPSSSGQEPQNPLLLLGQYSDDELEDEPSKTFTQAPPLVSSPAGHKDQDRSLDEDANGNAVEELKIQTVISQDLERDSGIADALNNQEGVDAREGDTTCSTDACKQMDPSKNDSILGTSNVQVVGDVSMAWKIVLHEESNQYYYWNTESGETSWEVPNVLAQTTELTTDQNAPDAEKREVVTQEVEEPGSVLDGGPGLDNSSPAAAVAGSAGGSLASQSLHDPEQHDDESIEEQKSEALEPKVWVDHIEVKDRLNDATAVLGNGLESTNYLGTAHDHKQGTELPLTLITQCESLLERLTSLRGSDSHSQAHDWTSTYILEVQVRLCDIRSLSAHGSSLHPFWLHAEKKLSELEDMVNKKIYELAVSAQMEDDYNDEDAELLDGTKEKARLPASLQHETGIAEYDNCKMSACSHPSMNDDSNSHDVGKGGAIEEVPVSSSDSLSTLHDEGAVPSFQVNGNSDTQPEVQAGEDIDMDVDMEVEETIPGPIVTPEDSSGTSNFATAEQVNQTSSSLPPGDFSFVPPPPDDEWIPPPPPDNYELPPLPPDSEQVPPLPSDEPPSCVALPSLSETMQPLQYAHAYNISYVDPTYQCYENTVTVPSSGLFVHSDPNQVAGPDPSLYYGEVPHTFAGTASTLVHAEPIVYYDLQNGSVASVPSADGVHSSVLQTEVIPTSYGAIAPSLGGCGNNVAESGLNLKVDVVAKGVEGDSVLKEATASASIQNLATVANVKESSEDDTSATAAAPAQVAAAKVQSKALRSKKRTVAVAPSLRSNKKVSSLVDKWKAAKEELQEDEEEPENAYEILEKKRQREIEEWKAKQIASREAKDNANFQPLGGDWRERVKRRRAEAAVKNSAVKQAEAPSDKHHQPDLAELSKGLPTGWQVYWDEASKQVYYGNTTTLETTWTRPTK